MSDANYDTRAATAMVQVPEAEQVAQSAITACTRQGQESPEDAASAHAKPFEYRLEHW